LSDPSLEAHLTICSLLFHADAGMNEDVFPSQDILELKEEADRAKYREMMKESITSATAASAVQSTGFQPVMSTFSSTSPASNATPTDAKSSFEPQTSDQLEGGFFTRLGNLLQNSLNPNSQPSSESNATPAQEAILDDQDLKGRYYYDKFGFSPFDKESHIALRKAYIEGLVWNLKYYYEGCVSWDWHYPYHYGEWNDSLLFRESRGAHILQTIDRAND
jgi:5'-3' exonuclease